MSVPAPDEILTLLDGKWEDGTRPADLWEQRVSTDPAAYVPVLLAGLDQAAKKVRNGCAELASRLAAAHPELLVPHAPRFADNLRSDAAVVRWEAACTLGHLAGADTTGVVVAQRPLLQEHLRASSIVLQGYCVKALARLAEIHPELAPEILDALLDARGAFPSNRVGFVVEAMQSFVAYPELSQRALRLARDLAESPIRSVATKARRVLRAAGEKPARR